METKYLNIFQRCIRIWEQAHPYNAAQVLHVQGPADVTRITDAWNQTLAATGLGQVAIRGRACGWSPAPRQEVAVVSDVGDAAGVVGNPASAMEQFITDQMNLPLGAPPTSNRTEPAVPFRLFVAPHADSHHIGVIYQHWVADSVSMRMLLRDLFCRLHDPAGISAETLQVARQGLWHYFGPRQSHWRLAGGASAAVRALRQLRTARRLEKIDDDHRVVCSLHRIPDGLIGGLLAVARRRSATLNDLLLAAMARACDRYGPAPRQSTRYLALGTIVDLRPLSPRNLAPVFGLFLGFTQVVVTADDLKDRGRVLAAIAAQSAAQKRGKAAAASMLRMAAGYVQGRFLSPARRAAFYRNYMPFFGGVSNVNMNRAWPMTYHPASLLDYFRVAPTGPMVPVVVAATTMGERFSFVLTRRASILDAAGGAALAQALIDELTALHNMG